MWERLDALADSAFDADSFQTSRAARLPWIQDVYAAVAVPPVVSADYQLPRPLLRRDQFARVLESFKASKHPLASRIARAAWLVYLRSIPAKCVQPAFLCIQARYTSILKCKTLMARLREVLGRLHGCDFLKDPARKFNFDRQKARMPPAPHPRDLVPDRVAAVIEIDSDGEIQIVSDRVGVDPDVVALDSIASEVSLAAPVAVPVARVVEVPFAQVDVVELEQSIQRLELTHADVRVAEQESMDLPLPEPLEVEEGTLAVIESLESMAIGVTGALSVPLPVQGRVFLPVERIQLASVAISAQELEVETYVHGGCLPRLTCSPAHLSLMPATWSQTAEERTRSLSPPAPPLRPASRALYRPRPQRGILSVFRNANAPIRTPMIRISMSLAPNAGPRERARPKARQSLPSISPWVVISDGATTKSSDRRGLDSVVAASIPFALRSPFWACRRILQMSTWRRFTTFCTFWWRMGICKKGGLEC